ncbi:MAG TPA: hypothetical protein DEB31_11535 [Clostridiales bacterium]|nr:hypothetical protein [Clostridiales bacterium]
MVVDIMIVAAVGTVLFFAIRKLAANRKSGGCAGCGACGGGCANQGKCTPASSTGSPASVSRQ